MNNYIHFIGGDIDTFNHMNVIYGYKSTKFDLNIITKFIFQELF